MELGKPQRSGNTIELNLTTLNSSILMLLLKVLIPIINGMQEFLLAGKLFKRLMRILIEASVSAWKQLSRPGRMSR
jgi:hypothetical protein